jgi:FtsH-binding integral membrane protein
MTLGVTVALTVYAIFTKTDITLYGSSLCIFGMAFVMFGILFSIFNVYVGILKFIYCLVGVILYGFYLVYDV